MDLVQTLVSQLGVSEEQASGGAGMLLKIAKDRLGQQDFSKVAGAVPNAEGMIASAPTEGGGGMMGMLGKAMGSQGGDMAALIGGFSKLGLSPDMIQKFIPVIMGFVQQKGGPEAAEALQKAVKQ